MHRWFSHPSATNVHSPDIMKRVRRRSATIPMMGNSVSLVSVELSTALELGDGSDGDATGDGILACSSVSNTSTMPSSSSLTTDSNCSVRASSVAFSTAVSSAASDDERRRKREAHADERMAYKMEEGDSIPAMSTVLRTTMVSMSRQRVSVSPSRPIISVRIPARVPRSASALGKS